MYVELKLLLAGVFFFYLQSLPHNMWYVIWKTMDEEAYATRKQSVDAKLLARPSGKAGSSSRNIDFYMFVNFILGVN